MNESGSDTPLAQRLTEVAERGAPAQQAHARALLARLDDGPATPDLAAEAELLIDAFQHDPYLWRQSDS